MENFFSEEEKKILSFGFAQLKPICDQLISKPCKNNALELLKAIDRTPSLAIKLLAHYILVPIELHLRNDTLTWECKRHLVQCVKGVLSKTSLDDFQKIVNIYNLLFVLISDKSSPEKLFATSEEFLIDVLECVTLLMISPNIGDFYQPEKHTQLSFGVYKCTLIIKTMKAFNVQSKAFTCLLALTQTHDQCQAKVESQKVANLVKQMLPGIVLCCSQAVSVSALQNHSVTMGAVRTWGRVICLVMKDDPQKDAPISIDLIRAVYEGKNLKEPTNDWYCMADSKLKVSTDTIMSARNHPHWRTRLEVASACRDVLSNCSRHMSSSVNVMLETLIILSQDDMDQVSSPAAETLKHLFLSDEDCLLENLLEENLLGLLEKLGCIIDTNDESKQISGLHLLKGYLQCLGKERLPYLMTAQVYLEKLFSTLITITELETSHVTLLEDSTIKDFDHVSRFDTPWKLLRHFTDTKLILSKVEAVCTVLGQCCDVTILIRYLLDVFEVQVQNRREVCLLLSFILRHCDSCMMSTEDRMSVTSSVLDATLASKVWNVPISLRTPSAYNGCVADNVAHARCNVVQACLLCEVVGATALCVSSEKFRPCLFQCLYPLMERAGSQHELLSLAGLQAIQSVTQVCAYNDIARLISDNIDYLSHHVTLQLRQNAPLALDVIKVILQKSNEHVLPCIEDILEHALRQAPSMFVDENKKMSHLNMYLAFVKRIRQWYCKEDFVPKEVSTDCAPDYVQDLIEYVKVKTASENFEDVEEDDPLEEMNKNQEEGEQVEEEANFAEPKKEDPKHIKMVVEILNTCVHFIPSRVLNQQVIVLQILKEGLQVVGSYSEDVLLPLVHKVWNPLVHRLQDRATPLVLMHAFNLLLTLAATSKDFIRARTIKEVMPSLNLFLKEASVESHLKDSGSAYRLTFKYKLQLSLLTHLPSVMLSIGFREKDCGLLLASVSVYLSGNQPAPLQTATVELFRLLMTNDILRYVVWTRLMCLWPEKTLYEASCENDRKLFKTLKISEGDPKYKNNVMKLYEHFHQPGL